MIRIFRLPALAVPALALASLAFAQPDTQVVYRLVDKNGKTTYAGKPPGRDFDGQVTRIVVDLKANRATLNALGGSSPPVTMPLSAPELARVKADAELARAEAALESARRALEGGKEPTAEETQFIGKAGGGARPVLTDAYHARMRKLEDAVKAAEADVDRARKAARQAAID